AREALAEGLGLVEDAARVVERYEPRLRQLDPALGPDEERLAEITLERADLVAHRRLREGQPLGGLREVGGVRHLAKGAELEELHPSPILGQTLTRLMLIEWE